MYISLCIPAQSLLSACPLSQARATAYMYTRQADSVVYMSAILPCSNWRGEEGERGKERRRGGEGERKEE